MAASSRSGPRTSSSWRGKSRHALQRRGRTATCACRSPTRASAFRKSTCRASSIRISAPSSAAAGSGLATTYSIVKNHGGLIGVDSQPGRGTTMEVHFPASALTDDRDDARPRRRPVRNGRPRVLVMDDEASVRTLAANYARVPRLRRRDRRQRQRRRRALQARGRQPAPVRRS